MSVYIARFRVSGSGSEALVVSDRHDPFGRVIGEVCHGWHPEAQVSPNGVDVDEDWFRHLLALDALTVALTAFPSFRGMLDSHPSYRPTLRPDLDPRYADLADAYDAAQAERGDPRRAHRDSCGGV